MQFMTVGTEGQGAIAPYPLILADLLTLSQKRMGTDYAHSGIQTFQRPCNLMQLQKKPTPHGPLHIEQF